MTDDAPTMAVDGFARKLWSEADRLALVAEFERWVGTQVSFCEAKGGSTVKCGAVKQPCWIQAPLSCDVL